MRRSCSCTPPKPPPLHTVGCGPPALTPTPGGGVSMKGPWRLLRMRSPSPLWPPTSNSPPLPHRGGVAASHLSVLSELLRFGSESTGNATIFPTTEVSQAARPPALAPSGEASAPSVVVVRRMWALSGTLPPPPPILRGQEPPPAPRSAAFVETVLGAGVRAGRGAGCGPEMQEWGNSRPLERTGVGLAGVRGQF